MQCNFASVQKIKMKKLKKGYMIFTKKNSNQIHISKVKRDDLFMTQMMFFVVFPNFKFFRRMFNEKHHFSKKTSVEIRLGLEISVC